MGTESYQFKSVHAQQQMQQQQMMMQQQQMMAAAAAAQSPRMMQHPMMVPSPYISPYGGFQPHYNFSPYMQQQQQMMMQQQQNAMKNGNISDDTMSISSKRSRKSKKSSKSVRKKSTRSMNGSVSGHSDEKSSQAVIKDLFTKCLNNRHAEVEAMLAADMDPNTKDEHGNGILHVAAQNGNKRLMKVALRWGADINGKNKQGQTALRYLFAYKYENLAAYLISKGSDDTIQNEFGYTCYDGLRPAAHV